MTLFTVFAMMVSLAAIFAAEESLMCSPHKDYPTIMSECLRSVGISAEEARRFMPDKDGLIDINKEDFMEMCRQRNLYLQADECINKITKYAERSCPQVSVDYDKHLNNILFLVAKNCNDDRLNLECYPLLFRSAQRIGTCVDETKEERRQMAIPEGKCTTKAALQDCSVRILRECNRNAANLFSLFAFEDNIDTCYADLFHKV